MTDSPKPHPTPNRLIVMREIQRGELRYYDWKLRPRAWNTVTDRERTAIVAEFIHAGLAEPGTPEPGADYSAVRLTDAGTEYLKTYGKNGPTQ